MHTNQHTHERDLWLWPTHREQLEMNHQPSQQQQNGTMAFRGIHPEKTPREEKHKHNPLLRRVQLSEETRLYSIPQCSYLCYFVMIAGLLVRWLAGWLKKGAQKNSQILHFVGIPHASRKKNNNTTTK